MIRLTQSIMQFLSLPLLCYAVGRNDFKALEDSIDPCCQCTPDECTCHKTACTSSPTEKTNEEIFRDLDSRNRYAHGQEEKKEDLAGFGATDQEYVRAQNSL